MFHMEHAIDIFTDEIPVDPAIARATELAQQYPKDCEQWDSQLWRLHNIYWIVDKRGDKIKFQPNWAQVELLEAFWYLNIILKARQLGFTTFIDLLFLDNCVWTENKRAGIICHNRDDASTIFRDKVKYPFDHLPDQIRANMNPNTDSARELLFPNNSSIRVGTSLRSGTLNYLHISEYGKLCAQMPIKAKEVKSGALNTVEAGQIICIESTAEGRAGHFYSLCQDSQKDAEQGKTLTPLDYKFHFFPWWRHPQYSLDGPEYDDIVIPKDYLEYFDDIEEKIGKNLTRGQKLWYLKKAKIQGEEMKREYPSTPEEAFYASIAGAYYKKQMSAMRLEKRIRRVPYSPSFPVNTFWDFGYNDDNVILFHQHIGLEHRFINAYKNSGESLAHYVGKMQSYGYDVWGRHYLPWDAEAHSLQTGKTNYNILWNLGMRQMTVVDRIEAERDGIEACRNALPGVWIDEENCQDLIDGLDHFRKEWDDKHGTWKDTPLLDWASHPSKAFECFARGYSKGPSEKKRKKRRRSNSYMTM
jgi:hypothetical protein